MPDHIIFALNFLQELTVCGILNEPHCKDGIVRFTTVPLKPLLYQ